MAKIIDTVPLVNADGEKEYVAATPDVVTPPALKGKRKGSGGLFDPIEDIHAQWETGREEREGWYARWAAAADAYRRARRTDAHLPIREWRMAREWTYESLDKTAEGIAQRFLSMWAVPWAAPPDPLFDEHGVLGPKKPPNQIE